MTKQAKGTSSSGWFEVDREGLAKLCERRGKAFVLHELISNGWDTGAKRVDVRVNGLPGGLTASVDVEDDDPDGFRDIAHAYTLFAESEKKPDATKRGRFNVGEKLVLALCTSAQVISTKGAVRFNAQGRREIDIRRESGSMFSAVVRMTTDEMEEAKAAVLAMLPPKGVQTTLNGTYVPYRTPKSVVDAVLHTEIADASGTLRRTERKTTVEIHEPCAGEKATLYEMGVPVVETGDRYHVNVMQKVPLSVERDNVLPAFLRDVRMVALNAMAKDLTPDDASEGWVAQALEDEKVDPAAVEAALTARFGDKRVGADPSDREAEYRAKGAGFTVVPSGAFSKEAWKNVRASGALQPAGQVFPTQRPDSSDGTHGPRKTIPEKDWTPGMRAVAHHCLAAALILVDRRILVVMASDPSWGVVATWQRLTGTLTFNVAKLGKAWFSPDNRPSINALMLHELAHDADGGDNHLADEYHDEAFRLGAALAEIYIKNPSFASILSDFGAADAATASPTRKRKTRNAASTEAQK